MAETSGEAAQDHRLVVCLERLAEELERWGADHETPVMVRLRPYTEPFPTLVARATGPHVNVLAGQRVFWFERSATEPDGVFSARHQWLGHLDDPASAAATLGDVLMRAGVSGRDDAEVPDRGRR